MINPGTSATPSSREMSALTVVAEMFLIAVHHQPECEDDPQEQRLIHQARAHIGQHYGYQRGGEVPDVAIDMYVDQLIKQLRAGAQWPRCGNAGEIVQTLMDWGLVSGVMNRPRAALLH